MKWNDRAAPQNGIRKSLLIVLSKAPVDEEDEN